MAGSNKKTAMKSDDRIGDLPDSILHHILSFLDTKEVVGACLLSTRWRNLWVSVPVLSFDHSQWKRRSKNKRCSVLLKNNFMDFVDRYLFEHDGSSVTEFNISCSYCDLDRFCVWMTVAAKKKFQEIDVEFEACRKEYEPRELPDAIFCSELTIFKFKVKRSLRKYNVIQMPNSLSLSPQLKMLVLCQVRLPQGNSNGELMLSCPVLENLELVDCEMGHLNFLNISILQLKNMVILNSYANKLYSCQLKVFTPNLESLMLEGRWYKRYSLGSLPSLVYANIVNHQEPLEAQYLIQLLESISCATMIELSGCLQDPNHDISDMVNVSFSNLRCLKLGDPCRSSTDTILKLFKSCSCVETLILNEYNMKNWGESVGLLDLHHLKSLKIGRFHGYKYEYKFLELLLQNAVGLEKLTIEMGYFKDIVVEKINSLVLASSSRVELSVCI